jgi:hypothetical protein
VGWEPVPGRLHLFWIDVDHVTFIRYDESTGDQFVARPENLEYMRRGTSYGIIGIRTPRRHRPESRRTTQNSCAERADSRDDFRMDDLVHGGRFTLHRPEECRFGVSCAPRGQLRIAQSDSSPKRVDLVPTRGASGAWFQGQSGRGESLDSPGSGVSGWLDGSPTVIICVAGPAGHPRPRQVAH